MISESVVEITKELIRYPTVYDNPSAVTTIFEYISDLFKDNPRVITQRFEHNDKLSFIYSSKHNDKPDIILSAHVDVVAPAQKSDFTPREDNGILYGRGAADMKGQIAAMIRALDVIVEQRPDLSIGLMLTSDEEVGSHDGVEYLVNEHGFSPKLVVMPDSVRDEPTVIVEEKGNMVLNLQAKGTLAHGARPYLGVNANDLLIDDYVRVKELFSNPLSEDQWIPSCNLAMIHGGDSHNMVPDDAFLYLDIRYTQVDSEDEIFENIKKCLKYSELSKVSGGDSVISNQNDPLFKDYCDSYKEAYGSLKLEKSAGASDARFFMKTGALILLPALVGGNHHAANEWVDVASIENFESSLITFFTEKY